LGEKEIVFGKEKEDGSEKLTITPNCFQVQGRTRVALARLGHCLA
jgi:hypothetical protein